jgi:hypothetical protein
MKTLKDLAGGLGPDNQRHGSIDDRRRITRTGRRSTDPKPHCASCGMRLGDGGPHGSDAECIAALRSETDQARQLRRISRAESENAAPERTPVTLKRNRHRAR